MLFHSYEINFYQKETFKKVTDSKDIDFNTVALMSLNPHSEKFHEVCIGDIYESNGDYFFISFRKPNFSQPPKFVLYPIQKITQYRLGDFSYETFLEYKHLDKSIYKKVCNIFIDNEHQQKFSVGNKLRTNLTNNYIKSIVSMKICFNNRFFDYTVHTQDIDDIRKWQYNQDLFNLLKENNSFDFTLTLPFKQTIKNKDTIFMTGDLFIYRGTSKKKIDSFFFLGLDEYGLYGIQDKGTIVRLSELKVTSLSTYTIIKDKECNKYNDYFLKII